MRTHARALVAAGVVLPVTLLAVTPTLAAGKGKAGRGTVDTTAPVISVAAPSQGSTTAADLTASGSAFDDKGLASVSVQLDGGAWQLATGTTSWSLPLMGLSAQSHTLTARATDTSGNTATSSVAFSVASAPAPSPSPTASPTASPSPSPTASPTASPSPSPSSTSTTSTGTAPDTQGSWVSPEGVTINVSSAGAWTIAQVYRMVLENARDLSLIGPTLTINVQDTYASQTGTSASSSGGTFTNFRATMYLKGVNSTFVTKPDAQLSHEYGHVWTRYWLFMKQGGSWSAYLDKRWSSADGSVTLATDSRTGTSYTWDPAEIVADDYRLLFGSATAISQSPSSLNSTVVAPSQQPGLRDWFLTTWA